MGFLYGPGAETLILVTSALGKICPRAEKPKPAVHTHKTKKNRGLGTRAEIQTSAVDTRTSVWVSTTEKIVRTETRKCSRKFGVVSAPALHKNPAVRMGKCNNLK